MSVNEQSTDRAVHDRKADDRAPGKVTVQAVPLLRDNYAWLVWAPSNGSGGRAGSDKAAREAVAAIDPGEAAPVAAALDGAKLAAILLTHYHSDHIQGAKALSEKTGAPIYGPANTHPDHALRGGETLELGGVAFEVLDTPGHAQGHLSYFVPAVPALFTGDTLFSAGCGRLFDGTAADMFKSFRLYDALPPETLVCPGHEYTAANLAFVASLAGGAGAVPEASLECRIAEVDALRSAGRPSVPVTLETERATNPFLRASSAAALAELRARKDRF